MQAQKLTPLGYMNVMAHADAHAAAIKAAQQPQQEKPNESISLKDLPPAGQVQMAAQAGIQISPQDVQAEDVKQTLLKKMPVSEKGPGQESDKGKFPKEEPGAAMKAPSGEGAK